ncbi:hypothetical protein JCM1841_006937 [Sporobolomyces salmonicolor]
MQAAYSGAADPQRELNLDEKAFHDSVAQPFGDGRKTSFVEYVFWADRQREREALDKTVVHTAGLSTLVHKIREKGKGGEKTEEAAVQEVQEVPADDFDDMVGLSERDIALANARRVLRQAGWASVFYLITCDILGPFSAPYAIAAIGMVPGILLYILFGAVAALSGVLISKMFCRLDSHRFPIKMYGDLAERIFGTPAKHLCSILQSIQLVLNVGLICLSNGQGLSQIITGAPGSHTLCFSVCVVIWAICGIAIGQIRSLQGIGFLANSSVWLNLLIIFISMGFIANSAPNYVAAAAEYGIPAGPNVPTRVVAVVSQPIFAQVNGVFNMVFAYGGAMIFPEIMAEMRRPRDFIKGMAAAQLLIFTCYLLYGVFVYAYQGQYTLALAYQGVSGYAGQTIGNVLALITGIIAATLYGNIGLKVFYINIIEGLFRGPPLMSRMGHMIWIPLVFVYWALAFVVGSAIPSVGTLSGLVAAVCIFQFTYTFPPALMLGFDIKLDAAAEDEPWTAPGVTPKQIDTWRNLSRWKRGIFGGGNKRLLYKALNLLWFLAALATAGLGMWATGTDLRDALQVTQATSFGCTPPV